MKKSKFLALILAAIMVFGLLSGCGGDPAGQETPGADPNPPASGSAQPQTPSDGDFTIGFPPSISPTTLTAACSPA